jgi:hypothetical protein
VRDPQLAPTCETCGVRIVGHGMEANGQFFCSQHCADAPAWTACATASEDAGHASRRGRSPIRRPLRRSAARQKMKTGVPTGHHGEQLATSSLYMRMQPWLTASPMDVSWFVPWIR